MLKKIVKKYVPESALVFLNRKYREVFGGGYFGLNGLDRKLEKYISYDGGYYVELGANDGFSQSNTYYFELKRGWRGVLVEPSPHNFMICRRLRGVNNKVHCNACVGFDYKDKFVEIEYANLMSVSNDLELDMESKTEHIEAGKKHLGEKESTYKYGSIAKTLNEILVESNAPKKIDLLSLDVEGAELEVLRGVDFDMFTFKFMLIECRNIERLKAYLLEKKYNLIEVLSNHDYLFAHVSTTY